MSDLGMGEWYNPIGSSSDTRVSGRSVKVESSNALMQAVASNVPFRVYTLVPKKFLVENGTLKNVVERITIYPK